MRGVSRRRFLRGAGAVGAAIAARPLLPRLAWASHTGLDPAPFEHGVASGDPQADSVLLWTRCSAGTSVDWKVSTSQAFGTLVASGSAGVDAAKDRTVKVTVTGLSPSTTYYYKFEQGTDTSAIGRTKTLPASNASPANLRFAITSCQDFQSGYYHAWQHIADRAGTAADLDFVLFLGDYIYEYEDDPYGVRGHDPNTEIFSLSDYRRRYKHYRGDPHLREAHRQFPFICIWDDHEVANDRWGAGDGGAENHQAGEGFYVDREANAEQAYFEYIPIREVADDNPGRSGRNKIYRSYFYGDLAQIIAIDTRTYRDQPIGSFLTNPVANLAPAIDDPSRTILGASQKSWFKTQLADTGAQWKLVGNQVMIGHLTFGFVPDELANPVSGLLDMLGSPFNLHRDGLPVNYDQWDDYQPERREILEHIRSGGAGVSPTEAVLGGAAGQIDDVVFLTGDIHTSWAMHCMVNPGDLHERAAAVEFVGPSITTFNLNELLARAVDGPAPGGPIIGHLPHRSSAPVEAVAIANNPHMRYVELDSNGYTEIDVTPGRCQATYYHVVNPLGDFVSNPIENPAAGVAEAVGGRWKVESGSTTLLPA